MDEQPIDMHLTEPDKTPDGLKEAKNEVTLPIHYKDGLPGRNNPCKCGSKKKYKRCCLAKDKTRKRNHYYVK